MINKIFNDDNITQVVVTYLFKSRYISDVLRNKLLTKYLWCKIFINIYCPIIYLDRQI